MEFDKETKIAENDKCIFYKNIMTKDFKEGYKIVLAKHKKDNHKEYLLLKDNKPIYASQNIENIWSKIEVFKLLNK